MTQYWILEVMFLWVGHSDVTVFLFGRRGLPNKKGLRNTYTVLSFGDIRQDVYYSHVSFICEVIRIYKERHKYMNKNSYLLQFNDDAYHKKY
jgi:hypothetical protein